MTNLASTWHFERSRCAWRAVVIALATIGPASDARGEFLPNDPYFTNALDHQWYLKKIGMPNAWMASLGSPAVTVAVLDTGVITTTPDLGGRVLPPLTTAYIAPPQPPSPPGTLLPPLTDQQMLSGTSLLRHGNWVTSVAAMGVNNGIGGAGIGNFTILPIRITSDAATTNFKSIAEGIRLAADQGRGSSTFPTFLVRAAMATWAWRQHTLAAAARWYLWELATSIFCSPHPTLRA